MTNFYSTVYSLGRLGGSADLNGEPPSRGAAKIYTHLVL